MGARASVTYESHELERGGPAPAPGWGDLGTLRNGRVTGSTYWGSWETNRQKGVCSFCPHPRQNSTPGSAALAADSPSPGPLRWLPA